MEQKVEFKSNKKDQYIHYTNEKTSFKLKYEAGDNDAILALVIVPEDADWEHDTQSRLSEKRNILEFIGEEFVARQAPGGEYQITDCYIKIFRD